jgi:hypothetical protein
MNNREGKMEKEQYITSSLYTFENMREGNYLYVDKTAYLWKLINKPQSMFFFSRPRRFGKSLTLSTLKAIFQGKKELFKGLYIEKQAYDWKPYPVIHIDMGSVSADTTEKLESKLLLIVFNIADSFNLTLKAKFASDAFEELVKKLFNRDGKVVILIDEYDKPLLNNIQNENLEKLQSLMKGFYSVLKTCEPYERFVFITGVGKFLKVSIFSDLNNLTDISMNDDFATLCGYTEKELIDNFQTKLEDLANKNNEEYKSFLQSLKDWYDGYRFSKRGENVYNPVSLAKFIENHGDFNNYWFETGSPSILVKLIKEKSVNIEEVINSTYTENIFTAFMPTSISFIALMYQTGYLTIKSWQTQDRVTTYKLGFPNFEVEESFYQNLVYTASDNLDLSAGLPYKLKESMRNNDIDRMMKAIDCYLAEIPYEIHIKNEKYYQTIFYSLFKIIGYSIHAEAQTSDGRIDAYIENGNNIYIFEFKLDKSADEALEQIMNKKYYLKFQNSGKKITLVGANFDFETRKLKDYKKKEL